MKSLLEAAEELARLEGIRPRLEREHPQSILGIDNCAILDAEVALLRRYINGEAQVSLYDAAGSQAYDWLTGHDDYSPSEGWADLLRPQS